MTYLRGGSHWRGKGGCRKRPRRLEDVDLVKLREAYSQLETHHREILESHVEMILNFAIVAEYKDADTGNHIMRISDYSSAIGRACGLPPDELELLRYASPMHDIGKIGIPDAVLQKPGKLNSKEWEIMKTHATIGERMFSNTRSPLLKSVAVIAGSHHEKWDGSGYPRALRGEAIPLFGRIVAVADVFDALVNKRCYKPAWEFGDGLNEIEARSGKHFDPMLVRLFLGLEEEIRSIYDANQSIQNYVSEAAADLADPSEA